MMMSIPGRSAVILLPVGEDLTSHLGLLMVANVDFTSAEKKYTLVIAYIPIQPLPDLVIIYGKPRLLVICTCHFNSPHRNTEYICIYCIPVGDINGL